MVVVLLIDVVIHIQNIVSKGMMSRDHRPEIRSAHMSLFFRNNQIMSQLRSARIESRELLSLLSLISVTLRISEETSERRTNTRSTLVTPM